MSVPRTAVEHELTELHEIAGAEARAAGAVWLSGSIQGPEVAIDLQRPRDEAVEEIDHRLPCRASDHAQREIRPGRAVEGLLAAISGHREVERVAVEMGLARCVVPHLVFVVGLLVV